MNEENNTPDASGFTQENQESKNSESNEDAPENTGNESAQKSDLSSFSDFDIHPPVAEAIGKLGWKEPTPIQALCLPHSLSRKDVAGFAQTGTGKTGVFLITLGSRLLRANLDEIRNPSKPLCVVLAPTRELAVQIEQDASEFLGPFGITSLAVYGGIDYAKQANELKKNIDLIVATPGRLMDYINKKLVTLDEVGLFVCDEADRMFDMGFIDDVEFFLERIPEHSQKLLFSATTNDDVKELAFKYLEDPVYIAANPETLTPEKIDQNAIHCSAVNKLRVQMGLLKDHKPKCAIIFTNTKLVAEWLHFKLIGNGIDADLITGDLPQNKRIRLIKRIKEGNIKALIATDVASRGLHIAHVSHVYNFDLPDDASNYIHRVGRTARAGAKGYACSLVCEDYGHNLAAVNELLGESLALKSTWFDDAYLKMEDKAGDPFAAGNRRPSTQQRGRAGPGKRPSPRNARDEGRKPSQRGKQKPRRGKDEPRANAKGRGNQKQSQKRKGQGRKRPDNKRPVKPATPRQSQETKSREAVPQSVGGIIKKIAKTLFGRK